MCARVTLTAHLTAGIPSSQEYGDQAVGALVILGTTEQEVLIFAAIHPPTTTTNHSPPPPHPFPCLPPSDSSLC